MLQNVTHYKKIETRHRHGNALNRIQKTKLLGNLLKCVGDSVKKIGRECTLRSYEPLSNERENSSV